MGLISGPLGRRAQRHFDGLDLLREERGANSLGVESQGKAQVRGNGNLALTADELLFAQWIPNRVTRIPRSQILEVTTAKSHLGKWIGRPLLKVSWTNERAEPDSIALWVRDLDAWLAALSG
ncbi:MAG TPA: hypothetical protein VFB52_11560 [Solirubrobacterales bacterium]|nr:hypothetical protein [Solirubrobacterales bacterium]